MTETQRILYIDDNQDHLLIVQAMLKREGYECVTMSSPIKGLEEARSGDYQLLLLDIQMPQVNGIDMMEHLREKQQETGLRIVAITADSTVFSGKNPYEIGFDAHLSKPIMPMDLSRTVKSLLTAPTD
ncbi:MAG: response regulator [Chloroflexota bacterium]